MPPTVQPHAVPAYNFVVSVTNVDTGETMSGAFSEVSNLSVEVPVIEYRAGIDDTTMTKIRGIRKLSNITLKRGVTGHVTFWRWVLQGIEGEVQRQQGHISLLNEDREEVIRWNFSQAWPTKYSGPSLNAKNNEMAIESVDLCCQDLKVAL